MVSRRQLLKLSALGTASFAAPLAYSASNITMTHNTGNPIGSTSPKDLSDNTRNLDYLCVGPNHSYLDRQGVPRKSWKGMEEGFNADQVARENQFAAFLDSSGFEAPVPYTSGIVLCRATQAVTYLGKEYRVKSEALPLATTNWEVDESKFKLIGDDSLRQDTANATDPSKGAGMLGWSDPVAPAFLKVISDMKAGEPVSIMRAIPKGQHESINKSTSTYDVSESLNSIFLEGEKFTAPGGSFYVGAQVNISRDGFLIEGAGMGNSKNSSRAQSFTRFWSDQDIIFFKAMDLVYPTFRDVLMQVTVSHSNPHIYFLNGAKGTLEGVRLTGVDDSAVGSGVIFDGGSMGVVDKCVFDNASIDVRTWDVHVSNSWVWANSKPFGIRTQGSIGNLLVQGTDIVPPRANVIGKKAGIYLTGPALHPKILGCFGDGNAVLDVGPFILAENGVIGLQVIGGNSSLLDEEGIVLDSVIGAKVIGHSFYNGNNTGLRAGAADIVLRQTPAFGQPLEKPLLQGNTHTQTVARARPSPAVLVKAGTQRVGMRIVDGTITQPGSGGGYTNVEILMEDGAFPGKVSGSLRGNAGNCSHYAASASATFSAGEISKIVNLGVSLAYLPRIDQVRVSVEGEAIPCGVKVVNVSAILVTMPAGGVAGGTIHVAVDLD